MNPEINEHVWKQLYAQGKNDLRYPNDVFVRCCHRYLDPHSVSNVLDYGFGTGANLIYLAESGFQCSGVEISQHALEKAKHRLNERNLGADLRCVTPGYSLPWPSATFDAVVAWQVLYYNDWVSWGNTVKELERVLKSGGVFLCATAAPGDVSHTMADSIGGGLYRSRVPGQEGCILAIPNESQLAEKFPGRAIEAGEFGHRLGETTVRHYVVIYHKLS